MKKLKELLQLQTEKKTQLDDQFQKLLQLQQNINACQATISRQYALSITTHPQRYDRQRASLAEWVEGSEVELTRELETVRSASTTS